MGCLPPASCPSKLCPTTAGPSTHRTPLWAESHIDPAQTPPARSSIFLLPNEQAERVTGHPGCIKGGAKDHSRDGGMEGLPAAREMWHVCGCGHRPWRCPPMPGWRLEWLNVLNMLPPTGITTFFCAGCQAHIRCQWHMLGYTRCCSSWP